MKKTALMVLTILVAIRSLAQTSFTSSDIYLGLKKLNVLGTVLYLAAHPDDENTRLLTYFSKDRLYRTGYLSLTRGDGGQNLIGDEQGIALGLIRTQELMAARRTDGAEQFFTRAYDFGFSKNPQETFTKWNKEKILADVVWIIRKFQPDVIITRFPATGEGGHGHHTASAILANEAFTVAADASRFPEQLKFVQTWQAKRIVWNSFNFGNNTPPPDAFKMDVGGYNPVLGKSYGEIAAQSRSQHKSQGFGVSASRGEAMEYFKTTGGSSPSNDLFDDVHTSWQKVKGGEEVERLTNSAIASFDFMQPQKSLPQLLKIYGAIKKLPEGYWKNQKIKEARRLIEQASGLWLESFTTEPYIAQGDSIKINFSINDRSGIGAKLENVKVQGFDTSFSVVLNANKNLNFSKTIKVFPGTPVTQPYWLQKPMEEGYFNIPDQMLVGEPDVAPAFTVLFAINIYGEVLYFNRNVSYKFADQVKGEQNQPVTVVPPITVYANPELLLFKKSESAKKSFVIHAVANKKINFNYATIMGDMGTKKLSLKDSSKIFTKGNNRPYSFSLSPNELPSEAAKLIPSVRLDTVMSVDDLSMATIRYDHIPFINYFYTDWVKLVPIDLITYGKKIGYIVGAGDKVPDALEQMGYEVVLLTEKEMARNNFAQYDAIISGVRAFNSNDWMGKYYDKLMRYVEDGGNYIVQYSQANNIRAKMGPYNFTLAGKRITDENATVSFLRPGHAVLNFPNKITENDFKGWVQERSIYHAALIDSAYQTILRMNDPGEAPDDGSLIIAKYGKGFFSYTGLVFFRELPAGVPGAYRLIANLIALNQKKEL